MDWSRPIDAYCERLGPGFWAEPVNAATNAAFLVAAVLALAVARRRGPVDWTVWALAGITAVVGVGSFLFHTFATRWAAIADTTPILLFILGYLATALARFCGLGWRGGALGVAVFLGATALAAPWLGRLGLGSSGGYLPALAALVATGAWLGLRRHPAAAGLLGAAAIFAVSLTLRSLDTPLCGRWPLGTHFAWHLANGTVLGLLLVTLARHGAPLAPPPAAGYQRGA